MATVASKSRSVPHSAENYSAANVVEMSATFVDMFQKNSPGVKISDTAIGAVIVYVPEDTQVVARKTLGRPEIEDDFVGMV